jgi:hypothetical protein
MFKSFAAALQRAGTVMRLQGDLPEAISRVHGFTIKVVRRKGCILHARPKGSAEDAPRENISIDEYLEVTVTCEGINHLYQDPESWVRLMTNSARRNIGRGVVETTVYRNPDERYARIEILDALADERDDTLADGRNVDTIDSRFPLPRDIVWLRVTTITRRGQKSTFKLSLLSQPQRHIASTVVYLQDVASAA